MLSEYFYRCVFHKDVNRRIIPRFRNLRIENIYIFNFNGSCQFALLSRHAHLKHHHPCMIVSFPNTFVYTAHYPNFFLTLCNIMGEKHCHNLDFSHKWSKAFFFRRKTYNISFSTKLCPFFVHIPLGYCLIIESWEPFIYCLWYVLK